MADSSEAPHGGAGLLTVPSSKGAHTYSRPIKKKGFWFLLFGVLLPIAAMVVESNFHLLAENFFDPFPSPAHLVLFALIPFSNFLLWLAGRRDMSQYYGFMALASGMAMGVGILYSVMCLPLAPVFCFYSLACGFGLLGLAPLLSIPCSFAAGKTVTSLAHARGTYFDAHQVEHIGHLIVLIMVVAVELPSTLTRINLSEAISHKVQPHEAAYNVVAQTPENLKAIEWLRRYGNREVLLRACYEHSGKATDILGSLYESGHPIAVQSAREVYYKVTGKPFNTEPIPASFRATIKHNGALSPTDPLTGGVDDEFDLDTGVAGENVSGMARGLALNAANLSGKVDAEGSLAQLTFSFDFENTSKYDREARAQILLPPGGVVSHANLTVNGVSRDAVIVSRSFARQQYQAAVQEKRDPLLVSYSGIDKVLVQCFPVAPRETMKVTLDIAAPLTYLDKQKAVLELPRFSERNFAVKGEMALELVSDGEIKLDGLHAIAPKSASLGNLSGGSEVAVAPPSVAGVAVEPQDAVEDRVDQPQPNVGTDSAQAIEDGKQPVAMPAEKADFNLGAPEAQAGLSKLGAPEAQAGLSKLGAPDVQACAPMPTDYKSRLLGALDWSTLAADGLLQIGRSGKVGTVWCSAAPLMNGYRVVSAIAPETYQPIKKLAVVIDGSSSMAAALPAIVEGLKGAPKNIELSISLVGDSLRTWPGDSIVLNGGAKEKVTGIEYMRAGDAPFNLALQGLAAATAVGGQDNSRAVATMLSQSRSPDRAVLWIHGPQPLAAAAFDLQRELAVSGDGARLFDMQVVPGPNAGLDGLSNCNIFRVKRAGTKQTDIGLFFLAACREKSAQTPKPQFSLELPGADDKLASVADQRQVSGDLLKVMAAYEMRRMISGLQSQFGGQSPASLGEAFGIVGPQTSAIVVSRESHSYLPPKQSAISAKQILLALGTGYKVAMEYTLLEMHPLRVFGLDGRDAALYQSGGDTSSWLPNPAESIDRYFKGVVGEMNNLSTAAGVPTAGPQAAPAAPFLGQNRNVAMPSAPESRVDNMGDQINEYKDFSQAKKQKADLQMSDAFGGAPAKEESPFEGDQSSQVFGVARGAAGDDKQILSLYGSPPQQPSRANEPSSNFPTLQGATSGTIAAENLESIAGVNTAGTISNGVMGFGYLHLPEVRARLIQESGIFYSCLALFATLSVWLSLRAGLSIKRKQKGS